jgi:acetate---CoA ligase (ADP-forming)
VPLAGISEVTRERLAAVLEPGLPPTNPLDAWGTGNDADQIFASCIQALLDDPATAALALNLDLTTEPTPDTSYTGLAIDAAAATAKPVAVVATLASAADPTQAATLRAAGIPVLEGTASGLTALRHLLAYRDFLAGRPSGGRVDNPEHPTVGSAAFPHRGPTATGSGPAVGRRPRSGARRRRVGLDRERARWRGRLGEVDRPLDEAEGLAMLGDWGVPVVAAEVAVSVEEALAAAGRVGWPVALKTAAPGVVHKSDVGGVVLGVDGPDRLAAAYADLATRLGPRVLVAAMAGPGVELALGVVVDPQFGQLVMVAAGGVLVEVLRDRRFALPPVDRRQAMAMLDRLAVRPLLDGVRGAPPADLDAVADAVANLSVLALDLGDRLAALDVNPLVAGPAGCVAVDALVVARAGEAGEPRSAAGGRSA